MIEKYPREVLSRVSIYLSPAKSKFRMNRIGRDGGGTAETVCFEDVGCYRFLLELSSICPGALRPEEGVLGSFLIPNPPLLWKIRDKIKSGVEVFDGKESKENWLKDSKFVDEKRTLYEYQENALADLVKNHQRGMRGSFIWLNVGSGKTMIVLRFLSYLLSSEKLPPYVFYTLPSESIMSIITEIKYFGIKINVMIPLKNLKGKREPFDKAGVSVTSGCTPREYHINLILHDHLRLVGDELPSYLNKSYFVFDEVHLFLNHSLRTAMGMNFSKLCLGFQALTSTPVIDNKTEKLIPWLEQIVPFEVTKANVFVAANNMISKEFNTGILTETSNVLTLLNGEETKEYNSLVPPGLGGSNINPTAKDWIKACDICYEACDRKIIKLTLKMLEGGVMIVVRNYEHQSKIEKMLRDRGIDDIFLVKKDNTITLTNESVQKGGPNPRVVIVPKNKAQGYSLTTLSTMLSSVYPSNNATREQLRGRINRIGQKAPKLFYKTVHCGILTKILENHDEAVSLTKALQCLAKKS